MYICMSFAGIWIAAHSVRSELACRPADLLKTKKKTVTLKEVQSLTGPLNFTWSVILLGRAFLRRLTDLPIGIQSPFHLPCFLFANTLSDGVESWLWSGVLERAFRMKQTIIIAVFLRDFIQLCNSRKIHYLNREIALENRYRDSFDISFASNLTRNSRVW